ncbi:MAG: hypothetical protein ACI8RD_010349 [Bacillariaceae sp.]|jgi:hypothetical protein
MKNSGFQLAKKLSTNDKIDSITILQDDSCNMKSEPFQSYASDLSDDVTVVYAKLGDESVDAETMQKWLGGDDVQFEYIYDNYSKGPEGSSKALLDCVKNWGCCKLYTYVSSAGVYQPTDTTQFPMGEDTTPIKESSGQAKMDNYVSAECNLPLVSFRPRKCNTTAHLTIALKNVKYILCCDRYCTALYCTDFFFFFSDHNDIRLPNQNIFMVKNLISMTTLIGTLIV